MTRPVLGDRGLPEAACLGSLTRLTPQLGYEPELAEEILASDDALVWTFKLKRGVEFHNGKTMTADDVIYTMNCHIGEDASKAGALVNMVDRWEKVNDYEVRAVLNSPNADLLIALGTFHFKIIQDGVKDFSTAIGTGPYWSRNSSRASVPSAFPSRIRTRGPTWTSSSTTASATRWRVSMPSWPAISTA